MFKDIISHQEGQYLFPGMPTVIKGNQSATPITMKGLQKPQIAVTPYGASYMTPGMDYNFAGNTVAEIPVAQMGGSQQDQITQLIVAYAQKIGKDPKEIIAQLQQLSQQEQQQALQAIVQDMQQSAPGADADQDMMEEGGCIDCQEQFPQAQNLNWFYKAQGGEAFPQANTYPESWVGYSGNQYAEGGESFPQAQAYLPYDRPGETRRNFMFEFGGQSDIDKIYQVMKKGGFNINPKKKRGGKLDTNSFMDYVMKNGGYVPEYQNGRELGPEELFPETRRERRMRERLERDMGEKVKQPKSPRFPVNPYNPTALEYANMMTTNTGKPTLTQGILAGMNLFSGLSDAFGGYGKLAGKLFAEGGDLPKHQTKGQIGSGYDPYLTTGTPMQEYAIRMQQQQQEQQQPTQIASWNQTEESVVGTPQPTGAASSTPNKSPFDLGYMNQKAARSVNKLGYVADFLERWNQEKDADKRSQKRGSTDLSFGVNPLMDRGDYTTNVTQGPNFRPDQYRFAQKDVNYYDKGPLQNIVKYGGILDQLEDGGVYDLSDDEIREILSAGGSIEYI